jgi:uncharacterized membrane protein
MTIFILIVLIPDITDTIVSIAIVLLAVLVITLIIHTIPGVVTSTVEATAPLITHTILLLGAMVIIVMAAMVVIPTTTVHLLGDLGILTTR